MALSILNNSASLNAQYNLNQTQNSLNTSLQRLSSGLKINSAADGPAAYVVAQQDQAQVTGLNAAIDNTAQATNAAQTADGALGQIDNLLQQIRGLAVDSANAGVNDNSALAANQAQVANALSTIHSIAQTSQSAGAALLTSGSASGGASLSQALAAYAAQSGADFTKLSAASVTTQAGAQDAITAVDQVITDVGKEQAEVGAFQSNTLQAASNSLNVSLQNTTGALSTTENTDFAAEAADFTQQNVLLQSGTQVLKTAEQSSQLVLSLLQGL